MIVQSPAKINLHLRVGAVAKDGFHPILSWFITLGLCDTLDVRASDTPGIRLTCNRADLAVDRTNLIVRAAEALAAQIPGQRVGADIHLRKFIPMGGGLGGGSSNAAFAMMTLNRAWNLYWPAERLAAIGAKIGSDVPFFFYGPSSICAGRGEKVKPTPPPRALFVLLIFPGFPVSTAEAYRRFDKLGGGSKLTPEPWREWAKLPARKLLPHLVNDLEAPAFAICPKLGDLRQKLEGKLGQIVRMSGSGSTLFTLADDEAEARLFVRKLRKMGIDAREFELNL